MKSFVFAFVIVGLSQALAEESGDVGHNRVRRTLLKKKLCYILGHCSNEYGGYGGYGGGYGGHGGGYGGNGGGYGGNGGGYGGYPAPINIGISQSQSSSSAGGGGFGSGYYPNNYQYNGGYGGPAVPGGYGYRRPGYFNNGYGASNNQFNGNYYGGNGRPQGYSGYQGPFGNFYDEGDRPSSDGHEDGSDYDGHGRSASQVTSRSDS
ncbi:unnamed protein product, partial [Iphiclides podalirius]